MRIAVGGISNESCSFSHLVSGMDDFAWHYGDAIIARNPFLMTRVDTEAVTLVWARAIPGGPVAPEVYQRFKAEFLTGLRNKLPLDGLLLDMHGALYVVGMEDAEGDFVGAVRKLVGPDCTIAASYDLHGNLSRQVIENIDILTAYRTAPHIDELETRERAFNLLTRAIDRRIRPYLRYIRVPVILPGEKTATTWEPGHSLYTALSGLIDHQAIWDASILVGYAWSDEPRSAAAIVVIGEDSKRVNEVAEHLAIAYWDARRDFRFGSYADTIEKCVHLALSAEAYPVFISDAGDNITGGGVGDSPAMLKVLLDVGADHVFLASIVDAEAVADCFEQSVGTLVSVTLGGRLDPRFSNPLPVTATIIALHHPDTSNRWVTLGIDGISVLVTERRTAFVAPEQFEQIGIHLQDYRIVALKLGYLSPEFSAMAAHEYLALSSGVIDQALEDLEYQRIQRPIFPLDPDMIWQPGGD